MNIDLVIALLMEPSKETVLALLHDDTTVFWIDWKQDDETIADSCETVLETGDLSGELVEIDSGEGYEVYLQYRDNRVKAPLSYTGGDRHITLCALNRVLAPDYEVRFCIDSDGGDTLAFLPLPWAQWMALEREFGPEVVSKHFYKFADQPNLFTDELPF